MRRCWLFAALLLTGCFTPQHIYDGEIEDVNCGAITGWAFDWNSSSPVEVVIRDGEQPVSTFRAEQPRGGFPPAHTRVAFAVPTPTAFFDGRPHLVRVNIKNFALQLRRSPRPLECPAAVR